MNQSIVSIVRYEEPLESVRKAIDLADGLAHLPSNARVFIKPNIVFWTRAVDFPKWGVITTSRVVEDVVVLLKEHGVRDIVIGEGGVRLDSKTSAHAFTSLGYGELGKRYGVKAVDVFEHPFEKRDLGDGVSLNFSAEILNADFVVDLPVLKTHAQTVVSLGIKNLKGTIDIASRKKCHRMEPDRDLHFWISRLAEPMPPMLTLIDGIYSCERGPNIDGKMHRSNLLIASSDVLAADKVGAAVLGYTPKQVPHLAHAAEHRNRPVDLSDLSVAGERIESVARPHTYAFLYNRDDTLPLPFEKAGIEGLSFRKFDLSLCTYCSGVIGPVLTAVAMAWKGEKWDDVEVLSGKHMTPTPGKKKTILFGKCMYQAHKDNPDIQEMIAIKGCPPKPASIVKAFHRAGIDVDPNFFENMDKLPGFLMKKYEGRPEFDPSLFTIK